MKTFYIETRFVFSGVFEIKAESKQEAIKKAEESCGMTLSSGIHSSLPDGQVDWEFASHPDKELVSIM